jgi:GxxExxY protein
MLSEEVTYDCRAAIFEVYRNLGPGLLESVYTSALAYELKQQGLDVNSQVPLPVIYKN